MVVVRWNQISIMILSRRLLPKQIHLCIRPLKRIYSVICTIHNTDRDPVPSPLMPVSSCRCSFLWLSGCI